MTMMQRALFVGAAVAIAIVCAVFFVTMVVLDRFAARLVEGML